MCLSSSNFLCGWSNFPHPPQLWHSVWKEKSCSALCSNLLIFCVCNKPKITTCPTDAQFNLSAAPVMYLQHRVQNSPHLPLGQGNFCLLRHSSLSLPHPSPTLTPSVLTNTSYLLSAPWSHSLMAALLSRVDAVNREMTHVYKLVLECFKNSLNKRWTTGICRWTSLISVFFFCFFFMFLC